MLARTNQIAYYSARRLFWPIAILNLDTTNWERSNPIGLCWETVTRFLYPKNDGPDRHMSLEGYRRFISSVHMIYSHTHFRFIHGDCHPRRRKEGWSRDGTCLWDLLFCDGVQPRTFSRIDRVADAGTLEAWFNRQRSSSVRPREMVYISPILMGTRFPMSSGLSWTFTSHPLSVEICGDDQTSTSYGGVWWKNSVTNLR